ncbi:MAG: lysozyme [Oculatellaceae cyanobacterium bins.114]|nr:lysozyme [Oculatellaceae cyanobacterium bins.114]
MNLQTFIANRVDYQLSSVQTDRELIQDIQRHLHRLGFNPGVVNGVWNRQTHYAFSHFKQAHQLSGFGLTATMARSLLQAPLPQRELVTTGAVAASLASPLPRPVPPLPPSLMASRSKTPLSRRVVKTPNLPRVNAQALTIIKTYERLRLEAGRCPAGVLTIGYGSTVGVRPGQKLTAKQAEARLLKDLEQFERVVRKVVKVPLTNNQFSALVSFVFNVGSAAFMASTLLKRLNQGNYQAAAEQFLQWDKAGGISLSKLTQRRQAEQALFLKA